MLVGAGADVNSTDNDDNTPLHVCANHGTERHVTIARHLLDSGADALLTNNDGNTPRDDAQARALLRLRAAAPRLDRGLPCIVSVVCRANAIFRVALLRAVAPPLDRDLACIFSLVCCTNTVFRCAFRAPHLV